MSIILGLNAYHADASAALVVDGEVVFAIAEERLNRKKYYAGFPALSIHACLKAASLQFNDIDFVAIGRDPDANTKERFAYKTQHSEPACVARRPSPRKRLNDLVLEIANQCGVADSEMRFRQINVEHHLAHTASAFFTSGFASAAGITIDGSGDFVTCMMSSCGSNKIAPLHRIYVPESLGSFYSMICQFIGYGEFGDEGKVMGLAPLGTDRFRSYFQEMIHIDHGQLLLNPKYFIRPRSDQGTTISEDGQMILRRKYSETMTQVFGPAREPGTLVSQRDMDLACGLQQRFEDIYFALLNHLYSIVPHERVVMAGGCVLNSVANGKISRQTPFREAWIHPAAGDGGLALGAALYVARSLLEEGKNIPYNCYLGNKFDEATVEAAIKSNGVLYRRLDRAELLEATSAAIHSGAVVGWFQGRSEWGPRALGNRSILCHPGIAGIKNTLNARIKHREWFRPFAPVVTVERQSEVFENDVPSPYMLHVYKIRPEWRHRLNGVNHVDDTGRLQTLSRYQNPLFYDLIKSFERRTGIPVLLNTSFNESEPIVESPNDALDCFLRTKMDLLVAGPFLVTARQETFTLGTTISGG